MKKTILIIVGLLVVLIAGFFTFNSYIYNQKQGDQKLDDTSAQILYAKDAKNATYKIEGDSVTLKDGFLETPTSTTRYFGNELYKDLNNDGRDDVVFFLTQETGGTGVFFYVAAALNTEKGYVGSGATFIGDRIAPQTINSKGDVIVVNYADRGADEAFSTQPHIGKSLWLKFDPKTMQFGEVVQNFEGEANPSMMNLQQKTWNWVNDAKFTLTFKENTFSASTDCNGVGGEYNVNGDRISFTRMMSTLMYCEGSQEGIFSKSLSEAQNYHFTSKGELIFGLKSGGSMTFR